jgi:hypothetical protein
LYESYARPIDGKTMTASRLRVAVFAREAAAQRAWAYIGLPNSSTAPDRAVGESARGARGGDLPRSRAVRPAGRLALAATAGEHSGDQALASSGQWSIARTGLASGRRLKAQWSSMPATATPLPFWKAAKAVLENEGSPLDYREITRRALDQGILRTRGKTPEATMNAQLAVRIQRGGARSPFVRTAPGVFGLRAWAEEGRVTAVEPRGSEQALIRVPRFPMYSKLRRLLPLLEGVIRDEQLALQSEVYAQRGTPQDQVDWTDPDSWIDERLEGRSRELAWQIWKVTSR